MLPVDPTIIELRKKIENFEVVIAGLRQQRNRVYVPPVPRDPEKLIENLERLIRAFERDLATAERHLREAEAVERRRAALPLCACGCGDQVPLPDNANLEPRKYIPGHWRPEFKYGPEHPSWKGDDIGSSQAHSWLLANHPKTGICEECGEHVGASGSSGTHHAFKHHPQPHTRNREDYRELCPACHRAFDAAYLRSLREAAA